MRGDIKCENLRRNIIFTGSRWSILTYEGPTFYTTERRSSVITQYEDSMASHLTKILSSDDHGQVISSAKVLCETVKDFLSEVGKSYKERSDDESDVSISKEVVS